MSINNINLTYIKFVGIKCVNKPIIMNFYNNSNISLIRTKAIYGENGTGKTSIVIAVHLLKQLLTQSHFLANPNVQEKLAHIINKDSNEVSIEVGFASPRGKYCKFFRYYITLKQSDNNYIVSHEKYEQEKSTDFPHTIIYEVQEGIVKTLNSPHKDDQTTPIFPLLYTSMLPYLINKGKHDDAPLGIVELAVLAASLYTYRPQNPHYLQFALNNIIESSYTVTTQNDSYVSINHLNQSFYHNNFDLLLCHKENLLALFRYIKPNLKNVEIYQTGCHEQQVCALDLLYENYSISIYNECSSIKEILVLYSIYCALKNNYIVFADDICINIESGLFNSFLSHIIAMPNGQFYFTTNCVDIMTTLKDIPGSINFLERNGNIEKWVKKGNQSPTSLYRKGALKHIKTSSNPERTANWFT